MPAILSHPVRARLGMPCFQAAMSELRYHPFLDEWTITATQRQDRTFHPPDDYCPLCPTKPGGFPTEIPVGAYEIAVFENKFPSLSAPPPDPAVAGMPEAPVRPAAGVCEVVCYTDRHDLTFAQLPRERAEQLAAVWRERTIEIGARPDVEYVFVFENKGKEIGVTLSHPHGQIYGYPFVPARIRGVLDRERASREATGRTLSERWIASEMADGRRVVLQNRSFIAIVPFFARYPFEVWVAARAHLRSLAEMDRPTLADLADALHRVARAYDRLFGFSMPYVMAMLQEPAVPGYRDAWFRAEFTPPYRTADKLKYLAGSEAAAGVFINDTLPEETAARLRALAESEG